MASSFTKSDLKDMAYYFDDERLALVKQSKISGEFDSINETVTANNNYLQIYYHAKYNNVNNLEQHINNDIGLPSGLHTAIVYYVKYRLAEDDNDLRLAGYYWKKFTIKIKQHPYRKSGVRGIKPYAI